MKYDWSNKECIQWSGKIWSPKEANYEVFGSSNYQEFSSITFVEKLLKYLVLKAECSYVGCYFENSRGKGNVFIPVNDLSDFIKNQDPVWSWGVWVFSSKNIALRTLDIFDLLKSVEPNDFLLYVDLDGGLLAARPCLYE